MAENQDDTLRALIYKRGSPLLVLDQVKLPHEHKYIAVKTCEDGWNVINRMNVRGAPAIGLTGILSLSVQLMLDWAALGFNTKEDLNKFVHEKMDYLVTSRPTGVNLKIEAESVKALSTKLTGDTKENLLEMRDIILSHCEEAFYNDIKNNQDMGKFGSAHILSNKFSPPLRAKRSHAMRTEEGELPKNRKVSILTHCNTGSLATAGYGTALGVIRSLHSMGNLSMAYCTETRPYNQGSRLTAYELIYEKMPATLICDSAASALMATKEISAVIVGADRIAANGDTANKIGTLQLAIAAAHFGVPFYVAAPTSTIDLKTPTGKEIIIENRPDDEITLCKCHAKGRIPPEGIDCWNPSFDVTGAELITGGIVTEFGVIKPPVNTRQNLELLELDLSYSSLG